MEYLNTLYRDFSFLINVDYRNRFGEAVAFGGTVTGEVFHTGYSVYMQKKNLNRDLYLLCRSYPHLKFTGAYETETYNTIGFKISRDFKNVGELKAEIRKL